MYLSRAHQLVFAALPAALGAAACTSSHDAPLPGTYDAATSDGGDAGSGARLDGAIADAGSHGSDAGKLAWYKTCGLPVCRIDEPRDAGPNACDAGQQQGGSCTPAGTLCDPGLGCGVKLLCTDSDPTLHGCPISRAAFKLDIRYLNNGDLQRYHDEVVGLGLAHYAYRNDPSAQERLGFIIEDVEPSRFVDEARDRVDLYAYTSAVIAAVKVQEQRIKELEREVETLRKQVGRRRGR